jgi:PAS domain S-box-containing protein
VDAPQPAERRGRPTGVGDLLRILVAVAVVSAVATWVDVVDRVADELGRDSRSDEALAVAVGLIAGIAVVATRRWRQAEEEHARREQAESRFRTLVERVPAVAYVWDAADAPGSVPAGYISPQIERLLGFPAEEWLRHPERWAERVHPADLPDVLAAWEAAVARDGDFSAEYRIRRADGRWVWLRDEANPVGPGARGRPLYQGVMVDVTARKEAEEHLRSLVEQLPVAVYTDAVDDVSSALYVTPRYERLTGYTVEERLADPSLWVKMLHPDDRERVLTESDRTNRTGEPFDLEYRIVRRDGTTRWVHDHAVLVDTSDGTPVWQGVLTDVTERRRAREALARADRILQATAYAAERFLGVDRWDEALEEVLRRLGEAGDADRAFVYANGVEPSGETSSSLVAAWDRDPAPDADAGSTPRYAWVAGGFGRWAEVLASGGIVHAPVDDLPQPERAWFRERPFGTRAVLAVPVHVGDEWWGYVGFLRREAERWQDAEVEALVVMANTLGSAIARRRAAARLEEAQERYRLLVEKIPAVTYVDEATPSMTTVYVSPQVEAIFGFTPDEWRADDELWHRHVDPDDAERVLAAIERHNEEGAPYDVEYRFRHRDGRWLWVRDQAVVIRDDDGVPRYSQGVLSDVTPQKQAEEQLRRAEERFRAIVEHIPSAVYLDRADASLQTIYASPQIEAITGISPEEWTLDPDAWLDAVHPDDRDAILPGYLDAIERREPWSAEYRMVTRDGRTIWVHDETTFLHDVHGEPTLLQGVLSDVTERVLAERALRESERQEREAAERLRALDEMKNTFLAAVSHELRSPLTAILGLALTLQQEPAIDERDRGDLLRRLATNARKLDRLLKDLLDIDRLHRGIVEPRRRATDVGALARRTVEHLDGLGGRRLTIRADPVTAAVDPAKVERIVENLLSNAVRHTEPDRRIWLEVRAHADGVLIDVSDDGPGVPEELRVAIFEPFRQGPTATPHSPGTGVGLSLVARFAELHDGRAWIEERPGGGASFRVFLPGRLGPSGEGEVRATDGAAAPTPAPRRSRAAASPAAPTPLA